MPAFRPSAGFFRSHTTRSKSQWLVIIVFIPLLLLAAVGVRGLQMSRQAARESARREAEQEIRRASELLRTGLEKLQSAPPVWIYDVPPLPVAPNRAQELYDEALQAAPAQSFAILNALATQHPDARTVSGLPMLPLVEWRRFQAVENNVEFLRRAETLARTAVETHPSVLTPVLLNRISSALHERGLETDLFTRWQEQWAKDERVRTVLRKNDAILTAARVPFWLQHENESWWAEYSQTAKIWRLYPVEQLRAIAASVEKELGEMVPGYLSMEITLAGVPLSEHRGGDLLARIEQRDFVIDGVLHDSAKLYAEQNKQTLWLAALLGCAMMVASGGTWMMSSALSREQRLNELKSDFVSSVSHELRAPVSSMRIMAENLGSGIVTDETRQREYHRLIADECWRLSTLIENVLDLARIERNRKKYRFAESDVIALVKDAVELLQPRAAQRQQQIRTEMPESFEPAPLCDSLAIQQALINLLDNAIKFSPEKSIITVRLSSLDSEHWELSVSDQGPGIPKEEQTNVFERFYRIGSELQRETQGTGIGLSIVKHIAEGHGGRVVLENLPQGGAKLALVLPYVPPGAESESR